MFTFKRGESWIRIASIAAVLVPLALAGLVLAGDGGHGFIGVHLEEETDHPEGGARIVSVIEDSPAEAAGLEEGDVIVGVEGTTVRGPSGLSKRMRSHAPGESVALAIVRDGREETVVVELGSRQDVVKMLTPGRHGFRVFAPGSVITDCEDDEDCDFSFDFNFQNFGRPMLGVQIVDVTEELRNHLGSDEDRGVLIGKVFEDSPAEAAGLEVGDLIVSVDGRDVEDVGDILKALQDKRGESFGVEVIRDRRPMRLEVSIPEADDPSGPRTFYFHREGYDEAMDAFREAIEQSRGDAREALRDALEQSRDAMRDSRDSLEDALESLRKAGAV